MTSKTTHAVNRLNSILPLKVNQQALSEPLRKLHKDLLRAYVEKGRTLSRGEMAQWVDDVDLAVRVLKQSDLALFDEVGEPIGAYPFTMEQREHKLTINGRTVHSMCAMDSLSVAPMFDISLEINSVCRVTGDAVRIQQRGYEILNPDEVRDIYFGISWSAASSCCPCADGLCTEMIFLKGVSVTTQWLSEDSENRELFSLDEAIDFGARFFVPLME
ncbi:MAG: hypothetical protein GY934_19860 [Gammaproteobacteria bacterium]|nr:hypothetical protein [Gammaproteobacteria bacterium]